MSKLLKLKLALLAILTLDLTGKDHDRCLYSVTALRSDFTSSISNIDLVNDNVTCFVDKQAGFWFRFLQMGCSGLLSSETTWVGSYFFGCSRVETREMWMLPRDVTEKLSYHLQTLSSLFFDVMSSILRIRLDGWFSRCRGQSSGKSASRQRAKKYQQSYERCSRDVQARQEPRATSQERCF